MLNLLDLEKRDRTSSGDVFLNSNDQMNTDSTLHRSKLKFYGANAPVTFLLPITYVELPISAPVFADTGRHASSL